MTTAQWIALGLLALAFAGIIDEIYPNRKVSSTVIDIALFAATLYFLLPH